MVDLTGGVDAKIIKERYQREINHTHHRVTEKVQWLYKMNRKLKEAMSDTEKLEKDIVADEEERKALYDSLQNLLKQETDFEEKMWKTTQKGNKLKSITINQKFKDSEIEEARYDAMQSYLKKYPKYASKSSFSGILEKISYIESGIKRTKKAFHDAVARANKEIAYFPRNIMEAKNNVKTYNRILTEGKEELGSMRYSKSIWHKLASESKKLNVTLDTLNHKIDEKEDTINMIETEVKMAETQTKKYEKMI